MTEQDDHADLSGGARRSLGWSALSLAGGKLALFVTTLVAARFLVPEEFGVFAAGLVVVTYLEIGLDLGVGAAVIYEQEGGVTRRLHAAFTVNAVMSVLLTGAAVAAAPLVAALFGSPDDVGVFRAIAFALLLRGLGQVHDAVLQRELDFRRRSAVQLTRSGVRAVTTIALVLAGFGVWGLVLGLLLGEAAGTIVTWALVRIRPRIVADAVIIRGLLRFGLAAFLIKTVGWVMDNVDYLAVGGLLGPDELGVYAIAYRVPELIIDNVFWLFSVVAFPVYSRAGLTGPDDAAPVMLRVLTLIAMFGFATGTGLALVAHDSIGVLFGAQWAGAATPMALVALAMGVESICYASGDMYPAMGRPGLLLKLDVPAAIVLVVGLVAAAPWGLTAVAATRLGYSVVYTVARVVVARAVVGVGVRRQLAALLPALWVTVGVLAGGVPAQLVLADGPVSLVLTVIGGLVGGGIAALLGARDAINDARFLLVPRLPRRA